MDFTMKQWFIGIIVIAIIVILVDGYRRMRRARYDSLHMSLKVKKDSSTSNEDSSESDLGYGSEFPNGGARKSQKQIDKDRINKVRSQYDFGRDLSDIIQQKKTATSEDYDDTQDEQWYDSEDEEFYNDHQVDEPWQDQQGNTNPEVHKEDDFVQEEAGFSALDDEIIDELESDVLNVNGQTTSAPASDDIDNDLSKDIPLDKSESDYVVEDSSYQEPEQVSLDLDESVPVLMESVEDEVESLDTNEEKSSSLDDDTDLRAEIRSVGKRVKPSVEPTIDNDALDDETFDSDHLETRSANKPRYESKYFSTNTEPATKEEQLLTEVLVINVKAPQGQMIHGSDLLQAVLENGLRYGAMNIFHRHSDEDGEGPVIFSMANMLKPGVFDLKTLDEFTTAGVTFFMTMPVYNDKNIPAFELMLETAKNIASMLGAELKDDQRSVLTAQTIEHYKERIRDFSRRLQLEKNKG